MPTELKWNADREATFLYAVDLLRRGVELADPALADALSRDGPKLIEQLQHAGLTGEQIRQHLVPLGIQADSSHRIAETLMRKTIGGERWQSLVTPVAGLITDTGLAADPAMNRLNEELAQTLPPLHDRCREYMATLLAEIGRLTDPSLIPERVEVIAGPALSAEAGAVTGGGTAYLLYNMVSLESVGDDPRSELPEPLRLAWMIAQTNLDLPIHSENVPRDARPLLAALAMLMPVLAAGESLDLCAVDDATARLALRRWQIVNRGEDELCGIVMDWWATYRQNRPPMAVGLGALLQMLE